MICSNGFMTTDVSAIGLKSLRREILVDFGTRVKVESLKHCGTEHWWREVFEMSVNIGAS